MSAPRVVQSRSRPAMSWPIGRSRSDQMDLAAAATAPRPASEKTSSRELRALLRERHVGLELNLCNLTPDEQATLGRLSADEWRHIQEKAAAKGGAGIAYVECDAVMLPMLLKGLQALANLDCLSVWAPERGGAVHFGILGQDRPLRCNILGTPTAPLQITGHPGLLLEGRETGCRAIRESTVKTLNGLEGAQMHLPLSRQFESRPPSLPPLVNSRLHIELKAMLSAIATGPEFAAKPFDADAVALAFLNCAEFDEHCNLGFDLKKLTPEQVRCIEALPEAAWSAVQREFEDEELPVTWLDVHEDFSLGRLAPLLQPLSLLEKLTVSAPKGRGFFIDLARLRGPDAAGWLREVAVRPRADKQFAIAIPHLEGCGVKLVLARGASATEAQLEKSVVFTVNADGRTVSQRRGLRDLLARHPLAGTGFGERSAKLSVLVTSQGQVVDG